MSRKTALVTGGAGFLGSHLVERLVEDGVDVTVVDNLSRGVRTDGDFRLIEGDVNKEEDLRPLDSVELVVSISGTRHSNAVDMTRNAVALMAMTCRDSSMA